MPNSSTGSGTEGIEQGMQQALDTLRDLCQAKGYDLQDLCYVTLYVRSIGEYPLLNRVYHRAFDFHNPPTRVCVECPLPDGCHVVMEAIAYRQPVAGTISSAEERDREGEETAAALLNGRRNTMHVQGISHWAPANIGPYSQSTRVRFTYPTIQWLYSTTNRSLAYLADWRHYVYLRPDRPRTRQHDNHRGRHPAAVQAHVAPHQPDCQGDERPRPVA